MATEYFPFVQNAEAAALHGADIKDMLEEPMKVARLEMTLGTYSRVLDTWYIASLAMPPNTQAVGAAGFKINVIGPKADLQKMRPKLEPR